MLNSFGQEINSYNMDKMERAIMNSSPIAEEAEEEAAAAAAAGGIAPEDEKEIKGEGALSDPSLAVGVSHARAATAPTDQVHDREVLLLRHIKNLETRQREELTAKQTGAQGHLSFIKTAAALSVVEDGDVFLKYPFHVSWFGSKVTLACRAGVRARRG